MPDEPDVPPAVPDSDDEDYPAPIRWYLRLICALLGVAGVGAGSVAVFYRDVEAGPVAMMLIGAVFLLIALRGEWPSRLKAGDNEAEWYRRQRRKLGATLKSVVDATPAAQRTDLVTQISENQSIPADVKAPTLAAFMYESSVVKSIQNLVDGRPDLGLTMTSDRSFDAMLSAPDGRGVIVEVKRGNFSKSLEALFKVRQQVANLLRHRTEPIAGVILVSEMGLPTVDSLQQAGREVPIETVIATETGDAWRVVQAAQRLLGLEVTEQT